MTEETSLFKGQLINNTEREHDKVPEFCNNPFLLTDFLFSLSPQIENLERELNITEWIVIFVYLLELQKYSKIIFYKIFNMNIKLR
jgi:hypothetical protein